MTETTQYNYLVFEAEEHETTIAYIATGLDPIIKRPPILIKYHCVGGVRAADENEACRAVVGATRHVGKYAVIEATFIDFTQGLTGPEENRVTLNP